MDLKLPQALATLHLFNEKADKLETLEFTKRIRSTDTAIAVDFKNGKPVFFRRQGPSDEAADAFLLTFRFFVQNNEQTSFANVESLYRQLPIEHDFIDAVVAARERLNEFLDHPSNVRQHGQPLTSRYLMEVFLYGGLAHATLEKKQIYDQWSLRPQTFMFLWMEFVNVLVSILNVILWLREINHDVIQDLESSISPN